MDKYKVEDLMVPLAEYAVVPVGSTLLEAVLALEKAQEEFDHFKYRHRAILILDNQKQVIGKLSHLDALRALLPEHDGIYGTDELSRFGFSNKFIRNLHQHQEQSHVSLSEICRNVRSLKVENYMSKPCDTECIDHTADLTTATHQLVQEDLRSLLVTHKGEITGILRLTDLFSAVFHSMIQHSNLL